MWGLVFVLFFNRIPKARATKVKLDKWNYIKLKILSRKRHNRSKRQPIKGRKYLETMYLNKGLNVKICKKLKPIPAERKKYKKIGKRYE